MRPLHIGLAYLVCSLWVVECTAQEITPRLFWPTPKGTKVMIAGYSYSAGDVFFDYSIPIEDADSNINTGLLAYTQTLDLWGRTSNILFSQPYSWGSTQGLVAGQPARADFSAMGDLAVTLNVNLRGAPTMTVEDFMAFRADPRPLIGVSLKVIAPTGHYNPNKLINVGANRWAARLKLGGVYILKPSWLLELSANAWLFQDDDEFLMGKKEQDPVYSVETNLIKRIRPGLWASLDITYFRGGRQTIDGEPLNNALSNVKLGGTIVLPFRRRHGIKIGYVNGIVTRYGNDFDQLLISYQAAFR